MAHIRGYIPINFHQDRTITKVFEFYIFSAINVTGVGVQAPQFSILFYSAACMKMYTNIHQNRTINKDF